MLRRIRSIDARIVSNRLRGSGTTMIWAQGKTEVVKVAFTVSGGTTSWDHPSVPIRCEVVFQMPLPGVGYCSMLSTV
jgi:hypothetical protein